LAMASATSAATVARRQKRSCGRKARTQSRTSFQRDNLRSPSSETTGSDTVTRANDFNDLIAKSFILIC
jgi:hypothetical protein